ncbi:4-amino-4-deoxy-L-arabinose transferase-like glycosyltransferase [Pseudonocardia hierapolitana]|uniref:4-amino-4-deoxy-L-arabinose transferase-like glycosyltransferase n=1 Tax=Pseudonocardia hierapolitana TaxID=1128676 RepID=A0A561SWC3_9PSEU|nr:4-amino-4-deoxy-L-arabinose transferase-like glycosyltransferase [Pseudonocardia hierapolitana]
MATTISVRTEPPPAAPLPRRPPWARWAALPGLLAGTALLYLWGLSASGWANAFYSAAAQAGGESWTAWFFGSSDAANAITVDKTPAALWVTGLSVRLFGLSSWSILVPQALMGVATVALLYATVRRTAGAAAGLLAGAVCALTPVAVLMFRFNNPDALLTLLLVAATYAVLRAVEAGRTRWLVLAGVLVGLGFLTKMLQAFLVLPAFTAVWLLAAPVGLARRMRDLLLAGVAVLVSAGWWVLAVDLWPADARPYIGGSQTNSVLELVLGYNGLGRLTGDEVGSVAPGQMGGGGSWGPTGLTRLFTGSYAGDASWLLPAALVLLGALLWWTRRELRTDRLRAATLTWGGWLVVTTGVFSLMAGIFHSYYQVVLAPAIGALVGIGAVELWRRRAQIAARAVLAVVLAGTAAWAVVLLNRAGWQPWLAWTVLVLALIGSGGLLGVHRFGRGARAGVVAVAVVAALAAPAGWSIATAATPHTGAIPSSGPRDARMGGPGGGRVLVGAPGGGPAGGGPASGGTRGEGVMTGGNLLGAPTPSAELTALLHRDAGSYTWAAATIGSNSAAGYQLASGEPVMALGGFNGTDPFPTLAGFQQLVAEGRIHYFVGEAGRSNTASGGSDEAHRIGLWVQDGFTPITIGGTTVYDLTQPKL